MRMAMTAVRCDNFTRRQTFIVEGGVVFTVRVLEGMLSSMRNIPTTAY